MHRFTKQKIWEFVIVVTIILIVLYRLALVYDLVPVPYQPVSILASGYELIKKDLQEEAAQPGTLGDSAKWAVTHLDAMEKTMHERQAVYEQTQAAAAKCKENAIFRFFMNMGEEDSTVCSERDLILKNASKDITNSSNKNPTNATTNAPAATAAPGDNTVVTPQTVPPTMVPQTAPTPTYPIEQPVAPESVPPTVPERPVDREPVSVTSPTEVPAH
ncbi:MAG TPA: hypothetical protein VLG38_06525 [Gammaproteobacteria bacterium]|nr:hypothetical protein [Gammaproteobacteria bacterium]